MCRSATTAFALQKKVSVANATLTKLLDQKDEIADKLKDLEDTTAAKVATLKKQIAAMRAQHNAANKELAELTKKQTEVRPRMQ